MLKNDQISPRFVCGEMVDPISFDERGCALLHPWQHVTNEMCLGKVRPPHLLATTSKKPRNYGVYRRRSSQLEYNDLDCLCRVGFRQLAGANEIGKLMEIYRKSLALAAICLRNGAMYGTS